MDETRRARQAFKVRQKPLSCKTLLDPPLPASIDTKAPTARLAVKRSRYVTLKRQQSTNLRNASPARRSRPEATPEQHGTKNIRTSTRATWGRRKRSGTCSARTATRRSRPTGPRPTAHRATRDVERAMGVKRHEDCERCAKPCYPPAMRHRRQLLSALPNHTTCHRPTREKQAPSDTMGGRVTLECQGTSSQLELKWLCRRVTRFSVNRKRNRRHFIR